MAHAIPREIVDLVESVVHAIFDEARRVAEDTAELGQVDGLDSASPTSCNVTSLDAYRRRRSLGVAR